MPARPKKGSDREKGDHVDVFSRMDAELVRKLDELAEAEHRSRSAMVAWLTERYVTEEYPKLQAKRQQ